MLLTWTSSTLGHGSNLCRAGLVTEQVVGLWLACWCLGPRNQCWLVGPVLALNALHHTIPHKLCKFEKKNMHDLQCFNRFGWNWEFAGWNWEFAFHPLSQEIFLEPFNFQNKVQPFLLLLLLFVQSWQEWILELQGFTTDTRKLRVNILWLDGIASVICNFYLCVVACTVVWTDHWEIDLTRCWDFRHQRNRFVHCTFVVMINNSQFREVGVFCIFYGWLASKLVKKYLTYPWPVFW